MHLKYISNHIFVLITLFFIGNPLGHVSSDITTNLFQSQTTINVIDDSAIPVTGINVTPETTNLGLGGTLVLVASVEPSNATNTSVTWSSADPTIVSVDTNGELFGVSVGTTVISVMTVDGEFVAQSTVTVVDDSQVNVTGIGLDVDSATLEVGQMRTLEAIITPSNVTNSAVFWTSDDPSIVSVDMNGEILGVAIGSTIVSVTTEDGGFVAQVTITVIDNMEVVGVTSISVSPQSVELELGSAETLIASVLPNDASNQEVVWTSEDSSIVSVDANGEILGVAMGTTVISATTEDGNFVAQATITVNESAVVGPTGISISPDAVALELADTLILTASILPDDATNKEVIWASEDSAIVSVNQDGEIFGAAQGSTTITATTVIGDFVAQATITVIEKPEENNSNVAVTGISIDVNNLVLRERDRGQIIATILPENASNIFVLWVSEDLSIITVDSNGNVVAKKVGETTISATTLDGGFSKTITVTVLPNNIIVYPNPTTDFINITGIDEQIGVFIHNSSGVLIKSERGGNPIFIGDLSTATYLIRLSTGDRIRFVKR